MSQQVRISRDLEFVGSAVYSIGNVKGNLSMDKHVHVDDFDGVAIDLTNDYTDTLNGNSDAIALGNTAGGGGWVELTTGTLNDQITYLATALIFDISQNPIIEARIKIRNVTGTIVYFGFADADTEATPAATIDYASTNLVAAAEDAAGFVIDAEKGASLIYAASTNNGTANVTATTTALQFIDNATKVFRIALDSSGNASFYIDGVLKHYEATAVADVPLCAIFNFGTRNSEGSSVVDVDYLKKWQDRT